MAHYLLLFAGVLCAALGGELFLRAVVRLGRAMRVSAGIIGVTIAAFATSSPELSVAINAALEQQPQIALGDALGSNVVNIALILGVALVISPIQTPRAGLRRDFPLALAVPILTAFLGFDGTISRIDGLLLLSVFGLWLLAVIVQARRERQNSEDSNPTAPWRPLLVGVPGLLLLVTAGRLIVNGATGIAESFGISEFVVGATVVAVGTSVPELATAVLAKLRGHDEVSLGMLLGSNIFNGLWIVAVAAIIFPIALEWQEIALALGYGLLVMIAAFPARDGLIGRRRGLALVALYATYVAAVLAI